MTYAQRKTPPRTLTDVEQNALLVTSGEYAGGFRDHIIFSFALGTGLRESEIVALDVGDVLNRNGNPRRRIDLRVYKRCGRSPTVAQQVFLPDRLYHKLGRYLQWKKARGESLELDAPLFVSRKHNRLSARRLRALFADWQLRAGFDRRYRFHDLRHTACTNVYRRERDIYETQKFARHASITTTAIYTHPSDEDLLRAVKDLPC